MTITEWPIGEIANVEFFADIDFEYVSEAIGESEGYNLEGFAVYSIGLDGCRKDVNLSDDLLQDIEIDLMQDKKLWAKLEG